MDEDGFMACIKPRDSRGGVWKAGDEDEETEELREKLSLREAYSQLYAVVKLPSMRTFTYVLVACRLGMLPAEQVAASPPSFLLTFAQYLRRPHCCEGRLHLGAQAMLLFVQA